VHRTEYHSIAVNCCRPSPAQLFLASGPVGSRYQFFVRSKTICLNICSQLTLHIQSYTDTKLRIHDCCCQSNKRRRCSADNELCMEQETFSLRSKILWRVRAYSLLGNESLNTFPQKHTRGTTARLLTGNGAVNTPQQFRLCFLCGPCRGVIKGDSQKTRPSRVEWVVESEVKGRASRRQPAGIWAWEQRNWIESSLRNWQLQNNGNIGIRL
jgi:hypothetical protein